MPGTTIDGAYVDYELRAGGCRPIIFLHGGFGSSSQLWDRTMRALPPTCTGYALNNFIRSDAPPQGYNVNAFARRVGGFIKAFDLKRPVLVGHSMGGVVSQLTALMFPDLVGGLVLVCTGASSRNHELARRLLDVLKTEGLSEESIRSVSANWFHRDPPSGFIDNYIARAKSVPLDAMIDVQESLLATDLESRLPEISAPTLVVFGAHDTGRTLDHAETLLHGIPRSQLATMERSGHSPMIETPEEFDSAFHRFLATSVWRDDSLSADASCP